MIDNLKNIGFYTLSNERILNTSETSQMKRCEMIITEYCNFSCAYCRGLRDDIYGDRRIKQLSLDEIKRNIDYWCENQPLENIRFSGGEPTLHKNIREIIAYSKEKGIKRIAISTNGSNKLDLYKELVDLGCNDFSVSLDACCADDGDKYAGNVKGSWDVVVSNIRELSKITYVTVGVVLTPDNVKELLHTIEFADSLGVSDIRIISAAQWNESMVEELRGISSDFLEKYPILRYRVNRIFNGKNVRGLKKTDYSRCALILDDSIIAGDYHFPCVIYMREQGNPVGKIGPNMRRERKKWFDEHNCFEDEICKKNCLDVCVAANNKYRELRM